MKAEEQKKTAESTRQEEKQKSGTGRQEADQKSLRDPMKQEEERKKK